MRTEAELERAIAAVESRLGAMEQSDEYGSRYYEAAIEELNALEDDLDNVRMYGDDE